jgi:hypothetical protein
VGSAPAGRCHGYVVVAWWRGGFGARVLGVVRVVRAVTENRIASESHFLANHLHYIYL